MKALVQVREKVAFRVAGFNAQFRYAILVGVLVVIAILAIIAFRDKVSSLWDAISSGINSL